MKKIAAVLAAVVASLCVAAPAYAGPLHAVTQDPIGVTDSGVTLKGQVTPAGAHTAYYFDYGTTVAYGAQTPVGYVTAPPVAQAVQAQLNGLASGTTYHFRLVAVDGSRVDYGNDLSFTTSGLPGAGGGGGPGGLTGS